MISITIAQTLLRHSKTTEQRLTLLLSHAQHPSHFINAPTFYVSPASFNISRLIFVSISNITKLLLRPTNTKETVLYHTHY